MASPRLPFFLPPGPALCPLLLSIYFGSAVEVFTVSGVAQIRLAHDVGAWGRDVAQLNNFQNFTPLNYILNTISILTPNFAGFCGISELSSDFTSKCCAEIIFSLTK